MKNFTTKIIIAGLAIFAISCKNGNENQTTTTTTQDSIVQPEVVNSTPPTENKGFEIESIALAENIQGEFPYFKLPEGYTYTDPRKYHGTGVINPVDKEYFYNHGVYFPQEGKSFKAVIRVDSEKFKDKTFSVLEIQKSFDELISSLGGVKINNAEPIKEGEKDRLEIVDPKAYENNYMHSCSNFDNVNTYVIRSKDKTVFVQYNLGTENADITILEPEVFENKMKIIEASQIQKQLNEKGKSVLQINFDTDKATLKTDGKLAVAEITKVLQTDKNLKIAINGYTDNVGDEKHNLQLSKQRAETVKNELVKAGVDANRLSAGGFGQGNPIADNNSEDGKAKNRRVELIKMK